MLHFVTSYMKQNRIRKQTLESAQNGLEIIFKSLICQSFKQNHFWCEFDLVEIKKCLLATYRVKFTHSQARK